jgi:hypothetical protein
MQPLYLARIEDLGRGDLVKVDCVACHHVALLTPEFCCASGSALSPRCSTSRGMCGAAVAERGDEPSCRSSGGARAGEPCPRANQQAPGAGLGELGYGSTTAAKEVAPQIAAQSPSDRSEIRIKDAPVSGQLSAVRFSNASAGSPQAPRDRILPSTRSLHYLVCIKFVNAVPMPIRVASPVSKKRVLEGFCATWRAVRFP